MSWEQLKRESAKLEAEIEASLGSFATVSAHPAPATEVDEENGLMTKEESELCSNISTSMSKLLGVTDRMGRSVSTNPTKSHNAVIMRNRSLLHEFQAEFGKLRQALTRKRESEQLFRRMNGEEAGGASAQTMDPLLRERAGLQNSISGVDTFLGQLTSTQEELQRQRASLVNSRSGLGGIASRFPTISKLMNSIQYRQSRENMILAGVIALCICFTLWYLFG